MTEETDLTDYGIYCYLTTLMHTYILINILSVNRTINVRISRIVKLYEGRREIYMFIFLYVIFASCIIENKLLLYFRITRQESLRKDNMICCD